MFNRPYKVLVLLVVLSFSFLQAQAQHKKACFGEVVRAIAERSAKIWMMPDGAYDPVLGYSPAAGPRHGAPPEDELGLATPFKCVANPDPSKGTGTTPKFYCSVDGMTNDNGDLIRYKIKPHFKGDSREKRNGEVYGEFLSSRFSKALGFFADDEWVADVTCPDCEKSLTAKFQGAPFNPFQPAAGIELSLGKGIDSNCDGKDSEGLQEGLENLMKDDTNWNQVDAFKLWLAFIDHGDTKADNQRFACLNTIKNTDGTLSCEPGKIVFYVSDMGSTFGYAKDSESKARLDKWKGKDPIKVDDGKCYANAKSIGDPRIGEQGRKLLADGLQRLLDKEKSDGTITKVFRASRNSERDQPAEAWTAEFIRKADTVINAHCGK